MIAHINRRLINDWGYYYGIPPTLSETAAKSEMSLTQITINCVLKIYNLVNQIVNEYDGTSKLRSDRLNVSSKTHESPDLTLSFHGIGIGTGKLCRLNKNNNFGCFLPEIELLDTILESNRTISLMEYFHNSRRVPQRNLEKDNVWPVPTDFIPFDVFDKVYDTITVLPKPTILMGKNNEDE
ncbi:uncharacterized protein LOC130449707 [Diorhabda sublineata]|uniref:uncharacterized protein LOC130449707 n=1 Tax=Diorhabda sublineata TaxID=1163346 RepID=UPI0024E088F1|nr:uncharacterized protein LOC130449707 [Diorhabda sublineata]